MKTDFTNYCGVCQGIHEPQFACDGTPIDWAARKARARAWLKRPLKKHEKPNDITGYQYEESK